MTRLEAPFTSHSQAGIGTLCSTVASLAAPARHPLGEPSRLALGQLARRLRAAGGHALEALLRWHERARQRRGLQELSDHLLRDIGISRATALAEAGKPFWRG